MIVKKKKKFNCVPEREVNIFQKILCRLYPLLLLLNTRVFGHKIFFFFFFPSHTKHGDIINQNASRDNSHKLGR